MNPIDALSHIMRRRLDILLPLRDIIQHIERLLKRLELLLVFGGTWTPVVRDNR
jgi:hypothetical protein